MRDGRLWATAHPVTVQRVAGDHFRFGEPEMLDLGRDADVVLMRQDPPFDLGYITATHLLERIQSETLVVNDPASVRNAPEKIWVLDYARFMPPTLITRSLGAARDFLEEPRRDRGEAAARQWRQGGVQGRQRRRQPRLADRGVQHRLARAAHGPGLPARRRRGRQAHRPRRRRSRRRGQPHPGRRRDPLQPRRRRRRREDRADPARGGDLRGDRPRAARSAGCSSSAST